MASRSPRSSVFYFLLGLGGRTVVYLQPCIWLGKTYPRTRHLAQALDAWPAYGLLGLFAARCGLVRVVFQAACYALGAAVLTMSLLPAADILPDERPTQWAVPLANPDVPNLHRVSPILYRSAQPNAAGMQAIEALGIVTVINLRTFHNDQDELAGTKLLSEELSVKTWHIEDEDIIRVLRICKDPAKQPILIHCQHGADRTGVMCCMYRIVIQGWTKKDAIREMTDGGYGFWPHWTNIVRYVEQVDVETLTRAVNAP